MAKKKSELDLHNEDIIENAVSYTAWIYIQNKPVTKRLSSMGLAGLAALMLEQQAANGKQASVYGVNKEGRFALIARDIWMKEAEAEAKKILEKNSAKA